MREFIRRENIALFKKPLTDQRMTEAERGLLLRLLAEEKMKGQGRQLAPADDRIWRRLIQSCCINRGLGWIFAC